MIIGRPGEGRAERHGQVCGVDREPGDAEVAGEVSEFARVVDDAPVVVAAVGERDQGSSVGCGCPELCDVVVGGTVPLEVPDADAGDQVAGGERFVCGLEVPARPGVVGLGPVDHRGVAVDAYVADPVVEELGEPAWSAAVVDERFAWPGLEVVEGGLEAEGLAAFGPAGGGWSVWRRAYSAQAGTSAMRLVGT
ncbi:MAG: hypothetical protein M5T61_21575 [Acidimicrobiia bacterium]|nr:hypothetical protein [Acidimicrobiia bacterium]